MRISDGSADVCSSDLIADGIRNYQYLDRLAAMYAEHGVDIHRRQPGFLTGTNIPPSIAIVTAVLDLLPAAAPGVRTYRLELRSEERRVGREWASSEDTGGRRTSKNTNATVYTN